MEINEITEKVIGCLFKVSNTLGGGFLEKVYVNASRIEIARTGLRVEVEFPIEIRYEGIVGWTVLCRYAGGGSCPGGIQSSEITGGGPYSTMPELPARYRLARLPAGQFLSPQTRNQAFGGQPGLEKMILLHFPSVFISVHLWLVFIVG
jgi:hypothetical protein